MTARTDRFPIGGLATATALLLLPLLACPPTLSGEPCSPASGCPAGQSCVAADDGGRFCEDGTGNRPDAGALDAGPGLHGQLTLNNGVKKPEGHLAWVYAWEGAQALDAGVPPKFTAVVADDGTFDFPLATAEHIYTLLAQYDINGDGQMTDPADKFVGGGPFAVSTVATLDVPTYSCFVVSLQQPGPGLPDLFAAVADLPDIRTGFELAPDAGVDAGVNSFGLGGVRPLSLETDPHDIFGFDRYVYRPDGGLPADPLYQITFDGPGYRAVRCVVNRSGFEMSPSAVTLTFDGGQGAWSLSEADTLSWILPAGAAYATVDVFDAERKALATAQTADAGFTFQGAVLNNASAPCPEKTTSRCLARVTAVRVEGGPPSYAIEGSETDLGFQSRP